jgi:hypothetical protein
MDVTRRFLDNSRGRRLNENERLGWVHVGGTGIVRQESIAWTIGSHEPGAIGSDGASDANAASGDPKADPATVLGVRVTQNKER